MIQTSGCARKEPRVLSVQLFNIIGYYNFHDWGAKYATHPGNPATAN
jgi:hypothetical protein